MELIDTQQLSAQGGVAVQQGQRPADGLDELVVHRDRHVVRRERGLDRRPEPARPCVEHVPLDLKGQQRPQRVRVALVRAVETEERVPPDPSIR